MNKVPERGDIIFLSLDPTLGSEQRGNRPFLVLTSKPYNLKVGLVTGCPVTSKIKGYPFEVEIPKNNSVHGAVLVNQLTTKDFRARGWNHADKLDKKSLERVQGLIDVMLKG
ncbi:mRNA interferase MazF (plasmid) [Piscirickettsia salmonis]|nr:mRNA interferase MazF [Piscirickettsia salmonis]QGN82638.1 mRNA interferase MazF [Piscirickettsia salmonis]QGN93297.1 mRNA interferase MazF [Piscirickettsia salmonis]QGO18101.1 mRNA interferase MazF [Piscirickettsia salmonis]QGO25200.1 mRNA interferase MazF [Piscirickettsia salmonis]